MNIEQLLKTFKNYLINLFHTLYQHSLSSNTGNKSLLKSVLFNKRSVNHTTILANETTHHQPHSVCLADLPAALPAVSDGGLCTELSAESVTCASSGATYFTCPVSCASSVSGVVKSRRGSALYAVSVAKAPRARCFCVCATISLKVYRALEVFTKSVSSEFEGYRFWYRAFVWVIFCS